MLTDEQYWRIVGLSLEMPTREQLDEAYRLGYEAMRVRAAEVARAETVPESAAMPTEIILRVLAQDTAYVEQAIIAAVVATIKNIASAIERDGREGMSHESHQA